MTSSDEVEASDIARRTDLWGGIKRDEKSSSSVVIPDSSAENC